MSKIIDRTKAHFRSIPGYVWILIIIIAIGIFFRTYHFQDWLFLKGDQVRDAMMTAGAFDNGLGDLPLLGPKAGGTLLRLGPIFYYFQYISALIFQSDQPYVLAYPTLLFSILTLPLFYYLVRKYFSTAWSVALVAVFAFSFMLIDYSRYAWNPNATTFFVILLIVSILKIFSQENRHKYFWTVIAALSFTIATQLHFSAFVALPIILVLFMLFSGKRTLQHINWKQAIIFLGIFFILYAPVILSDVLNHGDNLKQFISSVGNKSDHESIISGVKKEAYYFGKNFLYLLSAYTGSNKLLTTGSQIFIALSFVANILLLKKEKDQDRKNFLLIILTFFSVFYLVYFPLAPEIDNSRFFLPLAFIPFIYVGFIFIHFSQYALLNKFFLIKIAAVAMVASFLGYNLYMDSQWVWAMGVSQNQTLSKADSFALQSKGNKFWWSWSHFQKIAAYMRDNCEKEDIYFTMSKSASTYSASVRLAASYVAPDKSISYAAHDLKDANACYYFVSQTSNDVSADIKNNFTLGSAVDLGNVNILRFSFPQNETVSDSAAAALSADMTGTDDEMDSELVSSDSLRKPRQFWGDVWKALFNKN